MRGFEWFWERAGDWLILNARTAAEFNMSCLPGVVRLVNEGDNPVPGPLGKASRQRRILVCGSVLHLRPAAVIGLPY